LHPLFEWVPAPNLIKNAQSVETEMQQHRTIGQRKTLKNVNSKLLDFFKVLKNYEFINKQA